MIIKHNSMDYLLKITENLKKHNTVILKCDTIYGIIGIPPVTFEKIRNIKGRSAEKQFLILIPAADDAALYTDLPLPSVLRPHWPGALTIIFPGKAPGSSVALRVPADPLLQAVMQQADCHLYSTSVNLQGEPPLNTIREISEKYAAKVDLIVDSGDLLLALPSTIIDIREQPYKLVRQGQVVLPRELFA